MTRTTLTAAATLALALVASAPAMAGCRSAMVTDVYGDDGYYDTRARDCAYWGVYGRGDDHEVVGSVAGEGTRVVTGSLGGRTRTRLDVRGFDNQIATQTRSGGRIDLFGRGDDNEIVLRAGRGGIVSGSVIGSGNYVRSSADN